MLTTARVQDVVAYVKPDFTGKMYGYTVKSRSDMSTNRDFCLRDYVAGPFRRWWSWKIRGNLYTGEDPALGRRLDMQVGVNHNCVSEKGHSMRCKSFTIKTPHKVPVSVLLNNHLYYLLHISYI